jgi:hypothetical protein
MIWLQDTENAGRQVCQLNAERMQDPTHGISIMIAVCKELEERDDLGDNVNNTAFEIRDRLLEIYKKDHSLRPLAKAKANAKSSSSSTAPAAVLKRPASSTNKNKVAVMKFLENCKKKRKIDLAAHELQEAESAVKDGNEEDEEKDGEEDEEEHQEEDCDEEDWEEEDGDEEDGEEENGEEEDGEESAPRTPRKNNDKVLKFHAKFMNFDAD